jgi:hypothetical protein
MTNAAKLKNKPLRIMLIGYPGTAKTGSLASLANAGFKLRIENFDGNLDPLIDRINPAMLKNVDSVLLEDAITMGAQYTEASGIPEAFAKGVRLMDNWKYKEDGGEVDLGRSKDWGLDTILVLDSITSMGEAAKRRATKLSNKTSDTVTDRVWNLAITEQANYLDKLSSAANGFHVIVIAHLKMISPRDVRKGDSDIAKAVKQEIADMLPTRLYPNVLGWQYPQVAMADWPIVIEATREIKGNAVKYALNLTPRSELDLKYPGVETIGPKLDISDGMLKVFRALSPGSFELLKGETE